LKLPVIILKWIFLFYAIAIPALIIGMSVLHGVGQGIQFVVLPPVVIFFLGLFWWMKNLQAYIAIRINTINQSENALFILQILWLFFFTVIPMILITIFLIWNRFEKPNPLETVALQCYVLLPTFGLISTIMGVIGGFYYSYKTNKIKR
jgi:hypothetical protein